MASKLVAYNIEDLPAASAVEPKHAPAELDAYLKVIGAGQAAGDGETYATKKLAQAAASSIKRGLKKYRPESPVAMRVWESAPNAWHFALRPFTPPAPKAPKAE